MTNWVFLLLILLLLSGCSQPKEIVHGKNCEYGSRCLTGTIDLAKPEK